MNITNQFQEVGVLLAKNRFISVLKKGTMSPISEIESDSIPCKKSSHHGCHRHCTSSHQEMNMVGHQRPGIAGGACLNENISKAT